MYRYNKLLVILSFDEGFLGVFSNILRLTLRVQCIYIQIHENIVLQLIIIIMSSLTNMIRYGYEFVDKQAEKRNPNNIHL